MRTLAIVAAVLVVTACAHARTVPATQPTPKDVAQCDASSPLLIIDGVVQSSSCAPQASAPRECGSVTPLYVVDGLPVADSSAKCEH